MSDPWIISLMDEIDEDGLARLSRSDRFAIVREAENPAAIIVRSRVLPEDIVDLPNLVCIGRAGAGVDNVPVDRATGRGIPVFNAPGANSNAVKEAVIGSVIALSRHLVPASIALAEQGKVDRSKFIGKEIQGRTMGIIGLGMVGGRVAEAALGLGMKVVGYDKYLSVPMALRMPRDVTVHDCLKTMLSETDILSLHVALTDETKDMIRAETIELMKPGAVVVNFARAEVVNAADMRAALDSGRLGGYATDFPLDEYAGCDKVLMTPHIGASTIEAQINCAEMVAEEVAGFLLDGSIRNSVNFPSVQLQRVGAAQRLVFANENVPGMISKVSSLLAGKGVNIMSMTNNSNSHLGYSIVDCQPAAPEEVLDAIRRIEGMLMVRALD